jgi:hypothetical protein
MHGRKKSSLSLSRARTLSRRDCVFLCVRWNKLLAVADLCCSVLDRSRFRRLRFIYFGSPSKSVSRYSGMRMPRGFLYKLARDDELWIALDIKITSHLLKACEILNLKLNVMLSW